MANSNLTIDRAILRQVRIPMREPFRISNGIVRDKESIVIELYSGDRVGYGEASPMSGSFYSSETPESTWHALANDLVPDLLPRTIPNPVEYAELLDSYVREPFARAGMECAVWDLFATSLETTIRELLGAPMGDIASGLAVGIYDSIEELLERIAFYLQDGYRRVKIKIAPGWDLDPLRAVRDRFGNIPLMVDANGAYRFSEHAELLRLLDTFDLIMIEQPLAADALADLAELARSMKTPICLDESADSLSALEEIIRLQPPPNPRLEKAGGFIINIKVQRVGGLWNAKKMHDRACEAGLRCWLGTMPELGIASAQALAIATLPGFVYPTDIEASSRWFKDDIIDPPIAISREGFIVYPERGYRMNREKLMHYTIEQREFQK
ncbi:MAG TPA: o-succinylbenzoate synthase [Candidatus Kapabacteria bacterium]|nr:o-succinylbenzoate synthase [Candidatus Kapabacteria bacterium]